MTNRRTRPVAAGGTAFTSVLTNVTKVIITSKNAAAATFQLSETVSGSTSLTIEVPPGASLYELSWDCGLRFATGVSISCPTSVGLNITYEGG